MPAASFEHRTLFRVDAEIHDAFQSECGQGADDATLAVLEEVLARRRGTAAGRQARDADELAVLDDGRKVLGMLSESYATRRYAEELEKNRRDLVGGD